jgi:long-chain acyl-CoA synthetase
LEKLEAQYKTCVSVLNLCVVADPLKSAAVGIVAPIEASLKKYIDDASAADMMDLSQLCKDARVIKGVFEELKKAGMNAGFKSAEFLGAITLVPEEWTSMNGLLTAAQKIKRKEIQAKYAPEVAKMYASL